MNKHLRTARYLTNILENRFRLFGFKFGLDPILGIFPGFGDIVTAGLSTYMVWIAVQMKMPREVISRMITNIVLDFFIGIIPLIGDFSDFVFKANTKNLQLLEEYSQENFIDGEYVIQART